MGARGVGMLDKSILAEALLGFNLSICFYEMESFIIKNYLKNLLTGGRNNFKFK